MSLPSETLLLGNSNCVMEDLNRLFQNSNASIASTRESFHTTELTPLSKPSILKAYERLCLRKKCDDKQLRSDEILLVITSKHHRSAVSTGKVVLKISNIKRFEDTLREINFVPALSLPVPKHIETFVHPQFDIDRSKFALGLENGDYGLISESDINNYCSIWKEFIADYTKISDSSLTIACYRRSQCSGIHIFVKGIKMRIKEFEELRRNAGRNKKLTTIHEQLKLTLDKPSNFFIAGCEKSGDVEKLYKQVNSEVASAANFPFCFCECLEAPLNTEDFVDKRRDQPSSTAASNSVYSSAPSLTTNIEIATDSDAQPFVLLRNTDIRQTSARSDCRVPTAVPVKRNRRSARSLPDALASPSNQSIRWHFRERELNWQLDDGNTEEEVTIIKSVTSNDNFRLACDKNILEAAAEAFDSFERFLPERLIKNVFAENIILEAVYHYVVPILFQQSALLVVSDPKNKKIPLRRYNIDALCTVLVTYALVVFDRHPNSRLFRLGETEFVTGLLHEIVSRNSVRSETDLKYLWNEIRSRIISTQRVVRTFISEITPTIAEAIISLLHLGLWSNSCPSADGIPGCRKDFIAICPLVCGIIKEYLNDYGAFFANVNVDYTDEDIGQLPKQSIRAQAMQRMLQERNQFTKLEQLSVLLLAIAHPFDGNLAWSNFLYPSWIRLDEEVYQQCVLQLAHSAISLCVSKSTADEAATSREKTKSKKKLQLSLSFYTKSIINLWQPLHERMQFPSNLVMTKEYRIFAIEHGTELCNVPLFRTAPAFATGTSSEAFIDIRQKYCAYLEIFNIITKHVKSLPVGAYLSYPDAKIQWDSGENICDNFMGITLPELVDEIEQKTCRSKIDSAVEYVQGILSLYELLGTPENLEKFIRFNREVKYRGRRKKVNICYSSDAHHGKSMCAKVLKMLYHDSCHALSFAAMSADNDSTQTNSAMVGAAGKMIAFVDEIPSGRKVSSRQGSSLSMHKIKTLTGDTTSTGYRVLYANATTHHYNLSVVTFSNNFPQLSETGDADVERLYPIKFPRKFKVKISEQDLNRKIRKTFKALDTIMLALEFCSQKARLCSEPFCLTVFNEFLSLMECRNANGTPFTADDDAKDFDPRTCPEYEVMMAYYNEEARIVANFVAQRQIHFHKTDWMIVRGWFVGHITDKYKYKLDRINPMLDLLKARFDDQRQHAPFYDVNQL